MACHHNSKARVYIPTFIDVPQIREQQEKRTSRSVFSDVHKGRPCTACTLCKEKSIQYTHPLKWKDEGLISFLHAIEPDLNIPADACICRNCRDSLSNGRKHPDNYRPRWLKVSTGIMKKCDVPGCIEHALRCTKLATREEIRQHLQCPPLTSPDKMETDLCNKHYRILHKQVNPSSYQWKCAVCSVAIRGSNYHNFRACSEPELFQKHLQEHTTFEGNITACDKVCMDCYRLSLAIAHLEKEKPLTTDDDFKCLIDSIKSSMTPMPPVVTDENQLITYALKSSAVGIAYQLLKNQALTLASAYDIFTDKVQSFGSASMSGSASTDKVRTPRWLLGQLSLLLKHHLAYTCRVKKHGTILYRQGRELDCLSHCLFTFKSSQSGPKPDFANVCTQLNERLRLQADICKLSTSQLDIEKQIQSMDPVLWDMVCILTQSAREKKQKLHPQVYERITKNLRRLFILHQMMFCLDSTCSVPFHLLTADLIDCHGGSLELIKVFNQLGICVSIDTLLRHIQNTVQHVTSNGLLQGTNYSQLTLFTMDNIDFMHSYAQVFSGNQKLSWHGTTLQAVQCKPSLNSQKDTPTSRRRSHALLSPMNSPDKVTRSPAQKKIRARTGTELALPSTVATTTTGYDFTLSTDTYKPTQLSLSIENFRVTATEQGKVQEFTSHVISYCLLQNNVQNDKHLIGLQYFLSFATRSPKPEVGNVKYVQVLDEVADSKDTVLHVISELYAEYICKHGHKYLVLVGDAKTYDVIQAIKYEYGDDLSWLIPYPGDWHILLNYQVCLMKPFFEAGLKDLAIVSSYPAQSIQNCSQFKRTHCFLMEVWEAMYRCMLQNFLATLQEKDSLELKIASTLQEFENVSYDELALYSVIRSFEEEKTGFDKKFSLYVQKMSQNDDTWKFWSRFVLEDCQPYIMLFLATRSENWHLRMASLKSMAADFTAFDHPNCQKLISQHIVDVLKMPAELIRYFENGGFVLSITGNTLHSVALDESHEMLINKHVKQTIVRPSKDYINRITQYIPFRVKSIENLKDQLFADKADMATKKPHPIMLTPDRRTVKSEENIHIMIQKIKDIQLLPQTMSENRGLINPFRGLKANAAQSHDLLSFNKIGRENFELRIEAYVLKTPSVKVPQRRKKLQTFTTYKKGCKRPVNAAQQELKRVQKCMRRKIAHANKTGTNPDVIAQQYIEFPRAICTTDGLPVRV